ncbi:hypothetical protein [Kocuria atrinae]
MNTDQFIGWMLRHRRLRRLEKVADELFKQSQEDRKRMYVITDRMNDLYRAGVSKDDPEWAQLEQRHFDAIQFCNESNNRATRARDEAAALGREWEDTMPPRQLVWGALAVALIGVFPAWLNSVLDLVEKLSS